MTVDERIPHAEEDHPQAARIRVTVNGEDRRLAPKTDLAAFLAEQNVPAQFVAVAVNNTVVRRGDHARVVLADGDVVEIVRMVGGGSGRQSNARSFPAAAHIDSDRSAHSEDPRLEPQKALARCP